jgi:hypothetical protein
LRLGWSTGYRGFADWLQDFSREEDDEKEELKLEQIQEDRKEGRIAGPFDRPPFPNYWCPHQAKVCKVFSIWKNRLDITDRSIRMINNKSFPKYSSKNSLTPRNDSGLPYWTCAKFLRLVLSVGKDALIATADVKSAYKVLVIWLRDWFLQVFRVQGKYFYDKTGLFGDVAAGDNWDKVKSVIEALACALLDLILRIYVDDITILWPADGGVPQKEKATKEFGEFLKLCEFINLIVHKINFPSTRAEVLGWLFDTMKMEVALTTKRKQDILSRLEAFQESRVSKKNFESFVGVISFCSQVITCLKAL